MFFKILLLIILLQHSVSIFGQRHHSIDTDKAALLSFKKAIKHDPFSRLANWIDETNVCNFTGVRCGIMHHRVVEINLNDSDLVGFLTPFLSNLTQLRLLHLANNNFFGTIPSELSYITNLIELKLGNNNLQGLIPESLSLLSRLKLIFLNDNDLSGAIPPAFFFNCTRLKNVDFSSNRLTGNIPPEIGNCLELWNLNLYNNRLTGEIPVSLGNATGMLSLDVENNSISGELPSETFSKFKDLLFLHLSDNRMTSHDNNTNLEPFFIALANCSELLELEMAGVGLGGNLPISIGGLSKNLERLQLQENKIDGLIPDEIVNLSYLLLLNLTSNFLNGTITSEIGRLSHLQQLSLSYNFFSAEVPSALGQLSSLGLLDLSHNALSGRIPEELGNLVSMDFLFLNKNFLTGNIPSSLGRCTSLQKLDLSYNRLSGHVPPEITGFREMRWFLNLSHNQLEGPLPVELSKLEKVEEIDLSSNNFSGSIISQISSCYALKLINLSNNSIQGHLPDSLGDLKNIIAIDVSRNKLSGKIPTSLNKITTLIFLDVSYNNLEGNVPTGGIFDSITSLSFLGNARLCGSIQGIPVCSHKRKYFRSRAFVITICIVIFISGFVSTIYCVIGCRRLRSIIFIPSRKSGNESKGPPELAHKFPRITHKELLEATGGFNDHSLVGSGSYGRVYRGTLRDGTQIAVKVLQLRTGNSTRSFNRECQVLKRIRHRNLIRIITACSLPEFKALVLPYMSNGSLDARLHPDAENEQRTDVSNLNLVQRVNICSDIAEGMAYLHHHSPVKVIHCDLKPSNVLLNDDMTALVSDFGIAKLVMRVEDGNGGASENTANSTANMLRGSVGYIAPEYGSGLIPSTKGDVYSYGVLVLEMVTRKRPTDEMFVEGQNLHEYVKNHYQMQMENTVDYSLIRALRDQTPEVRRMYEVAIRELIELGILCTQDSPYMRPTMLDCADDLDRLKKYLNGDTTATFASSLGISSSTLSDY